MLVFLMGPRIEHPAVALMPKSEMAARLLSETGKGPLDDVATLDVALRLAARASCYSLVPGPLGETAEAVAALIAS